jgi:hypothetical protein
MRPIQIFESIMIFFALISTLLAAFYACFGPPASQTMKTIDIVMEVAFCVDIIRNFFM